jgi:NAD(P)-dependent dehydrogenase (short-subunit alcohol dehydrogenase family)
LPLLADDAALIYIGAVSERLRLPGLSAYAAAKAGLEAFADSLRKEERKRQILVVRPGAVATPFWDKVPMKLPKDAASAQKVSKRIVEAYNEGMSGVLDLT